MVTAVIRTSEPYDRLVTAFITAPPAWSPIGGTTSCKSTTARSTVTGRPPANHPARTTVP